ncbi:hypothetical protein Unana1_04070 [Umbelopsis nana]
MARPSDDDDLARRVANLKEREGIDPNDMTDEALNARFQAVFGHESVANKQKLDYSVPDHFNEADDLLDDGFGSSDDDYLADILNSGADVSGKAGIHHSQLDAAVETFLGEGDHSHGAEEDNIVRQVQEELALEKKYQDLHGDSDEILEKRFAAFSKDVKAVLQDAKPATASTGSKYTRVYVPPPKPFEGDEEDETEGWCCK